MITSISPATHLTIATAGPMTGFKTMPLDIGLVLDLLHWCQSHGIRYGLGDKVLERQDRPPVFNYPPDLPDSRVDCSGFMRDAVYHGTGGAVLLPDGSQNQGDWLRDNGFKVSSYPNCLLRDGRVRICIARLRPGLDIGHVWMAYNAHTIESHGGAGPASRPVDTPILDHIVSEVYVVA